MLPESSIDVESLRAFVRGGGQARYVFFWGHQPDDANSATEFGRECLSQWFSVSFEVDGLTYASAEHFMMSEKARVFGDEETRRRILEAPDPDSAKRLGREVRNFDASTWLRERFAIVVRGSHAKFAQHPALLTFLLGTKDDVLVEASPLDAIWGIGLAADDQSARDPERWRGLNLLGFALMEARRRLRDVAT